jgi:sulfoxide reductase heme-binding subunit YedZ
MDLPQLLPSRDRKGVPSATPQWRMDLPNFYRAATARERSSQPKPYSRTKDLAKNMLKAKWVKPLIWTICLTPLVWLAWLAYKSDLGANPIERIEHFTGDWTLRLLLASLAITPLRKLLHQPDLIRFRRLLGLFAFFYACLHFTTYFWLDQYFDLPAIWKDILKRPYITAGFTAFVLLIPLAVTSTAGSIRRLGGKRWQKLHKLVYISAIAAVIHYYWLVKSDIRLPLFYGCLLAIELTVRVMVRKPTKKLGHV